MALGAHQADVFGLVARLACKLTLLGVAIGAALALGLARLISSLLFGVRPSDPLTLLGRRSGACWRRVFGLLYSRTPRRQGTTSSKAMEANRPSNRI
jgi:hypothetical protein